MQIFNLKFNVSYPESISSNIEKVRAHLHPLLARLVPLNEYLDSVGARLDPYIAKRTQSVMAVAVVVFTCLTSLYLLKRCMGAIRKVTSQKVINEGEGNKKNTHLSVFGEKKFLDLLDSDEKSRRVNRIFDSGDYLRGTLLENNKIQGVLVIPTDPGHVFIGTFLFGTSSKFSEIKLDEIQIEGNYGIAQLDNSNTIESRGIIGSNQESLSLLEAIQKEKPNGEGLSPASKLFYQNIKHFSQME